MENCPTLNFKIPVVESYIMLVQLGVVPGLQIAPPETVLNPL